MRDRKKEEPDDVEYREIGNRGMQVKTALIMVLLTLIAFVLLMIFSDGNQKVPSDEKIGTVDESTVKNNEITLPAQNDASMGQESINAVIDDDGGYWIIEALLVPEEWKK